MLPFRFYKIYHIVSKTKTERKRRMSLIYLFFPKAKFKGFTGINESAEHIIGGIIDDVFAFCRKKTDVSSIRIIYEDKSVQIFINKTKKIEEFSSLLHPCVKTKMIVKSKCEKLGRACMENDNSPVMPKITISVSDEGGGTVDCKAEYISSGCAN